MNTAFWRKAVADAWLQLVLCSLLLALFSWVFVWLMSLFKAGFFAMVMKFLPDVFKAMLGTDPAKLISRTGQLSILFTHPITLLVTAGWALGRGSDSVSGEIGRGTMDLVLSLPVRRATVILAPAVAATVGAAVLAASICLGIWLGLLTVTLNEQVLLRQFVPGAINLFCMVFCFTAVTTFVSSWNRDRWRTIILAGGFFVVSLIIEAIWRLWPAGTWLKYFTFLSAFQPQNLILEPEKTGLLALPQNGSLLALGVAAYAAALIILTYRDIPAAR